MNIQELRNSLEQLKGKKQTITKLLEEATISNKKLTQKLHRLEEALEVVNIVGLQTQQSLEYKISDLVSMALASVYDNPYEFIAKFIQRRNKSECDLLFARDGKEIDEPLDSSGGGVVDVASFALRVASWSLSTPKLNNVLLLDEPFKGLDSTRLVMASELLSQISKKLNLQIIAISHSPELIESADRVFNVTIKKGVSNVSVQG